MYYEIPIPPYRHDNETVDWVLMLGLLLLAAFLIAAKYRRELRRVDALVMEDECDPTEEEEEIPICPGCVNEITEHDRLCPHCSCPVGTFVTVDPIQCYSAIAYMTARGIAHPPIGFFFWPFILFLLARAGFRLIEIGFGGIEDVLFVPIFTPIVLLYLYAIYRTYRSRSATQTDPDVEDPAPPDGQVP